MADLNRILLVSLAAGALYGATALAATAEDVQALRRPLPAVNAPATDPPASAVPEFSREVPPPPPLDPPAAPMQLKE